MLISASSRDVFVVVVLLIKRIVYRTAFISIYRTLGRTRVYQSHSAFQTDDFVQTFQHKRKREVLTLTLTEQTCVAVVISTQAIHQSVNGVLVLGWNAEVIDEVIAAERTQPAVRTVACF